MNGLKAWDLDGTDTWAGRTIEEAVMDAMRTCHGPNLDPRDIYDGEAITEVSRDIKVRTNDPHEEPAEFTTVGEILDKMTGPGLVCSTEY